MDKTYVCNKCGYSSLTYYGKCPSCKAFSSMEEILVEKKSNKKNDVIFNSKMSNDKKPEKLKNIKSTDVERIQTSFSEFNRVVGNGLVVDSINILTAPPGTGKSTILLEIANDLAEKGLNVLYFSGEESETQIKLRADRILNNISENLYIKSETKLENIERDISIIEPSLVIIDSIQVIYSSHIDNHPGGDKQIITCASKLLNLAKNSEHKICMFFVGQMTKEDELRGSRELEHMVDAVFYLEGEEGSPLRLLRSKKNRFGNTEEVGLFEMNENGLENIENPGKYFITERDYLVSGNALTMIREGSRNLIIEIESLTEQNNFSYPMRVSNSISKDMLQIILAILEKNSGVDLKKKDVYIQIPGGLKIKDVSSGLSVLVSIYSSVRGLKIPNDIIFLGEVGLTGDLKKVPNIEGRIKDVIRMGYKKIVIPKNSSYNVLLEKEIKIIKHSNVKSVIESLKDLSE